MKAKFTVVEAPKKAFDETRQQFIAAAIGAVKDAEAIAVRNGRANIASAGFPARWQAALTSRFYRNDGFNPAALIYHKFGIASVFERGKSISGKPMLWLPIERNHPGRPRKPAFYGNKLRSVNRGRRPLLFLGKVPLFFGIPRVQIRRRFNLLAIFKAAADQVPEFLAKRLNPGK